MASLEEKVEQIRNSAGLMLPSVRMAEQGLTTWANVLRSLTVVEAGVRAARTTIRARMRAEVKRLQATCPHPLEARVPCHVVGGIPRQTRCTKCEARFNVE